MLFWIVLVIGAVLVGTLVSNERHQPVGTPTNANTVKAIIAIAVVVAAVGVYSFGFHRQPAPSEPASCSQLTDRLNQAWTEIATYKQRVQLDPSTKSAADWDALVAAKEAALQARTDAGC
jgi:hypothetical protein